MSCRLVRLGPCLRHMHMHALRGVMNKSQLPLKAVNVGVPCRTASNLWPISNFLEKPSMFSAEVVRKKWETIPVIIVSVVGLLCEFMWIIRQMFTRDDVRYCPKSCFMAFERNIDNIEKGDKPPIRKFRVYNQKYEWADELVDALAALREPTEEEKAAMEAENKKKKK